MRVNKQKKKKKGSFPIAWVAYGKYGKLFRIYEMRFSYMKTSDYSNTYDFICCPPENFFGNMWVGGQDGKKAFSAPD